MVPLFSSNIRKFMAELFEENEAIASDKTNHFMQPLADEQLEAIVRRLFSDDASVIASLDFLPSTCKSRIRIWRSEYNRGLWPTPQKVYSFRYGTSGKPINRHGNPLSAKEIASLQLSRKESKDVGTSKKEKRKSHSPA